MKKLNQFITEKLRLGRNIQKYNYHPKTFKELREIVYERAKTNKDDILDLNDIDISNIDNLSYLFERVDIKAVDMNNWDVSHVKDIHGMFWCNDNIEEIYIDEWDTSNIESFYGTFYKCKKLNILDLSNWKFDKCTEFDLMFKGCEKLDTHFADNWTMPTHPITANEMFEGCKYIPKWYQNI